MGLGFLFRCFRLYKKSKKKKSNSYNKQAHKYVSVYLCDKNAVIRNERRVSIHKFRM